MPAYSKFANTNTSSGESNAKSKTTPSARHIGKENRSAKIKPSGFKDQTLNTNENTSKDGKRLRKPSEKVAAMTAEQIAAETERIAKAQRKAKRAQRDASDTEDESEDDKRGDDEPDNEEEDETPTNTFSSRVVETRVSKKSDQATVKKPTLVRSVGRVPVSRTDIEQDRDNEDDEDNDEREGALDEPLQSQDRGGSKRRRSESTESIETLHQSKVSKYRGGQRAKVGDYDDITKECLLVAITVYRCLVSTGNPFPDHAAESQLGREAWVIAGADLDCDLPLIPRVAKLITNRASHLRGELKTKARPIVETYYDFESGTNKKIINHNRRIAESLKEGYGYAYKENHEDHTQRRGLYRNPLLQKIINVMWFRNRQDEGVVYNKYFHPMKAETIALVLTVVDCCIDEWMTGIRTECAFTTAAYRDTYNEHLRCLKDFQEHCKDTYGNNGIFENICEKLYNRGRFHAGAQPISQVKVRTIPTAAFDAAIQEYKDDTTTETDGETGEMSA